MTVANSKDVPPAPVKSTSLYRAWGVLIALTAVSWWAGTDHSIGSGGIKFATCLVLVMAFTKVLVVGQTFMELRPAAWALQAIFTGWCVAVCAAMIVIYLTS